MVRAAHLAAGAIAAAFLLAGAGGAVAAADTPSESAGSENANSRPRAATAVRPRPRAPLTTMRSPAAARIPRPPPAMKPTRRSRAPPLRRSDSTRVASGDEPTEEKKPVEPDHGTDELPRQDINRVPLRPEAPPPLELVPLPEAPRRACPRNTAARRSAPRHSRHARRPRHGRLGCGRRQHTVRRE